MTQLLSIEEPKAPDPPRLESRQAPQKLPPSWSAFLELGFRPLYLMGCCWSIVAAALWVWAPRILTGPMAGVYWHAHEMLWGFIAAIAMGFLLTAATNWTGIGTAQGKTLALLCLLWLLARIGFLCPQGLGPSPFWIAAASEALLFLSVTGALARSILKAKSVRNYGVPLLVLALGIADIQYLLAIWRQMDYVTLMERFSMGLICMAIIALLIGRRVIPFFASRAIKGLQIPMHTRTGQVQMAASILAIACMLANWNWAQAIALAATGLLALWQVVSWRPWAVRSAPLLWILYAGYAALGAGLLTSAAHSMNWVQRTAWPAHVIAAAGLSALIIGMCTRTALGHLGRALAVDRAMTASFILVLCAAYLRLAALFVTAASLPLLHISSALWTVAFALYLWRFAPLMIRPRADHNKHGKPVSIPVRMTQ